LKSTRDRSSGSALSSWTGSSFGIARLVLLAALMACGDDDDDSTSNEPPV
jgi:hypothetical protein